MQKASYILCSILFVLFYGAFLAKAQTNETIEMGVVYSENQEIVGGAKLEIDGEVYTSNELGKFIVQGYDLGRQPRKVISLKQGFEVSAFQVVGNQLIITVRKPINNIIRGRIIDENKIPIAGITVSLRVAGKLKEVKTNEKGNFQLIVPGSFRPTKNTKFIIEDSNIINSAHVFKKTYNYQIQVRKKPAYLLLNKKFYVTVKDLQGRSVPQTPVSLGDKVYKTTSQGNFTPTLKRFGDTFSFPGYDLINIDSVPNRDKLILYANRFIEIEYPAPTVDSVQAVDTVIAVVEQDPKVPFLSNLDILNRFFKEPQQVINEARVILNEGDLTPEEQDDLLNTIGNLTDRLSESEKDQLDIDVIQSEFTRLEKQFLSEKALRKKEQREFEAKQKEDEEKLIIFGSIGAVLLIFTTFVALLARQFRKQRNQIGEQKEKLEYLNVDLKDKNEQITDSIRAAELIQEAILPITADIKSTFSENFILFRPKDIVSGDFYWYKESTDESGRKLNYIAAIDCTGHGVPGAFMSMIGNTLLNEIIDKKSAVDTNEILEQLDEGIIKALKQDTSDNDGGMDVCFCKIIYNDDDTIDLQFSGAKRPLYLFMEGSNELLKLDGTIRSIGGRQQSRTTRRNSSKAKKKRSKKPFEAHNFVLKKGSEVYLSSDGLVDQNGKSPDGTEKPKFGTKKLLETLKEIHTEKMEDQSSTFHQLLEEHKEGAEQRDDITLIGLRL